MILTCPACGTQYVVKDGAIPPGGRKVRCASCRHSWHQEPEPEDTLELPVAAALPASEPAEQTEPADEQDMEEAHAQTDSYDTRPEGSDYGSRPDVEDAEYEPLDEPAEPREPGSDRALEPETAQEPRSADDDAPRNAWVEPTSSATVAPPGDDDEFSPFARRGPAEDRPGRPLLRILLIVLLVAALVAAFWFLAPPQWKARLGLSEGSDTPLQLMMTHSDRQQLESGQEMLTVRGRVINPTGESQTVPPITAELRDASGEIVHRWSIAPPARVLEPGASATFNSANVSVPTGGEELTVTLGATRA